MVSPTRIISLSPYRRVTLCRDAIASRVSIGASKYTWKWKKMEQQRRIGARRKASMVI